MVDIEQISTVPTGTMPVVDPEKDMLYRKILECGLCRGALLLDTADHVSLFGMDRPGWAGKSRISSGTCVGSSLSTIPIRPEHT